MIRPRRLFLLPGTGADHRLFPGPWVALPRVVRVDWPEYVGEESLGELAERLISRYDIADGDVVGGVSLGGMVAHEIARRRRLAGLMVIASTSTRRDVNPVLRTLAPLLQFVPLRPVGRLARLTRRPECIMFADTDPRFLRAAVRAIMRWDGVRLDAATPVLRIHGARDRIIRPPAKADVLFPDAGHMFTYTHGAAACETIARFLDGLPPGR